MYFFCHVFTWTYKCFKRYSDISVAKTDEALRHSFENCMTIEIFLVPLTQRDIGVSCNFKFEKYLLSCSGLLLGTSLRPVSH